MTKITFVHLQKRGNVMSKSHILSSLTFSYTTIRTPMRTHDSRSEEDRTWARHATGRSQFDYESTRLILQCEINTSFRTMRQFASGCIATCLYVGPATSFGEH